MKKNVNIFIAIMIIIVIKLLIFGYVDEIVLYKNI